MPSKQASQQLPSLIAEAQRRGYLSIKDEKVTYHSARDYEAAWSDPEEKARAQTYALWLAVILAYLYGLFAQVPGACIVRLVRRTWGFFRG